MLLCFDYKQEKTALTSLTFGWQESTKEQKMLSQITHSGLYSANNAPRELYTAFQWHSLWGRTVCKKAFSFIQKRNTDQIRGNSKMEGMCLKKKKRSINFCLAKSFSSSQLSVLWELDAKKSLLQTSTVN